MTVIVSDVYYWATFFFYCKGHLQFATDTGRQKNKLAEDIFTNSFEVRYKMTIRQGNFNQVSSRFCPGNVVTRFKAYCFEFVLGFDPSWGRNVVLVYEIGNLAS